MTAHRPWTPADIEEVSDETKSEAELALILGRSPSQIRNKRYELARRNSIALNQLVPRQKTWTDDDLAVAADKSISITDAAKILGRSKDSVKVCRSKIFRGVPVGGKNSWTDEERQILLETIDLPMKVVAERLGRSVKSVQGQRTRLREQLGLTKPRLHDELNPWIVGKRTLVAKTCLGCGLIMDASWYQRRDGNNRWSSTCAACERERVYGKPRKIDRERARERERQLRERYREMTMPAARSGMEWTSKDHEIASDPSKGLVAKAIELERTYEAVARMTTLCGYKSANEHFKGDRVNGEWQISFENDMNRDSK